MFPVDIQRHILNYLDDEDLANNCMLNKDFARKVCNDNFWINKIIDRYGLTYEEILKFKGKNTTWGYYMHLSEILHENDIIGNIERVYHHPDFEEIKTGLRDAIINDSVPRWVDLELFMADTLYKIARDAINRYFVNSYFHIADQDWVSDIVYNFSDELQNYIKSLLNKYAGLDKYYDQVYVLAEALVEKFPGTTLNFPDGSPLNEKVVLQYLENWIKQTKLDNDLVAKMSKVITDMLSYI